MKKLLKKIAILSLIGVFALPSVAFGASYYTGNGSSGALTITTSRTEDSVNSTYASGGTSGQKNITIASATGFSANDWVFIFQDSGTGSGNYEVAKIDSISTNTLTLKANLTNSYAAGAIVIKINQYSSVTINSGGSWGATYALVAMVSGNVTINAGGGISTTGTGFTGSGGGGTSSSAGNSSGLGGGGGATSAVGFLDGAGGGGGGYGTSGSNGVLVNSASGGTGGSSVGNVTLSSGGFVRGSGGSGGSYYTGSSGSGGNGGGAIFLIVGGNITNGGNGIASNGSAGSTSTYSGGGGGSGGAIRLLVGGTLALGSGLTTASGGSGASAQNGATSNGGSGGSGRIATLDATTVTGTSSPTINETSTDVVTGTDPYSASSITSDLILFGDW